MSSCSLTRNTAISYWIDTISLAEMLVRCRMCQFIKEPANFKINRVNPNDLPRFISMTPLNINDKIIANISIVQNLNDFYLTRVNKENI